MWKKVLILLLGLVGTFSVVYASKYEDYVQATSITSLTGRVGELQERDNVLMQGGTDANGPLGWKLLKDTATSDNPIDNGWFAMSTRAIAHTKLLASGTVRTNERYDATLLPSKIAILNADFTASDKKIINPRYYGNMIHAPFWDKGWLDASKSLMEYISWSNELTMSFTPTIYEMKYNPSDPNTLQQCHGVGITNAELRFTETFWLGAPSSSAPANRTKWSVLESTGAQTFPEFGTTQYALRPAIYLDLYKNNTVVFSLANGYASDLMKIDRPDPSSYEADTNMKIRLEDTSRSVQLDAVTMDKNGTETPITSIANKENIHIKYSNVAEPAGKQGMIALLLIDQDGELAYYVQLADSSDPIPDQGIQVQLDVTPGDYTAYLVNELLTSDNSPTYSSPLSNPISLSVASELQVDVTNQPQGQSTFEYSKNVNKGDTVAVISSTGGVQPITYTVVSDNTVVGHSNDYQKFTVGADVDGNPVIQVAENNGLEAGTYNFKVKAIDANGDPSGGIDSGTVTIDVAKTDPDLKFNTSTAVDKVIGDSAFTELFTHNNSDTMDANFSLTYSSSNLSVATVDTSNSNTDTDIQITPGNQEGTTTIKVELAETKNFKSASANLTVNVHPKISLAFTPEKPAFAVNEVLTQGTKVGKVTLTGNSPDYTYSMAVDPSDTNAGANNGMFKVSSSTATNTKTMDILTDTASIGQGNYNLTIKVEDAYGQVAYAKGTINVSGIAQTDFKFYDYKNPSTDITNGTLTIYYGETNAKLIASGEQSTGAVTYELDAPTTDIIEVDPDEGNITVKKVGKVKVKATKAADATYNAAVIYMDVEVKQAKQEIAFVSPNTTTITYDSTNGNTFSEKANGKIKTGMPNAGVTGVGGITYSLGGSDASIASIDPSTGDVQVNAGQNITSMKTFAVTAKLNETGTASYNANYEGATVTKTINVYPPGSATWNQTSKPEAEKNVGNEKIGDLSVTGGSGNVAFTISTSGDADNLDKEFFHIDPTSGEVVLKKKITVSDLVSKTYNTTQKAYEMKVMVDVSDAGNVSTEHLTIYITGAERANLDFKNKDDTTQEITETYDINKQFQLSLKQSITGTEYQISTNPSHTSPTDVITVNTNGKADILNANEVNVAGSTTSPVYVEAVVPASGGYKEMIIEAPVRIKRKDQTLAFSQNPINTSADIQSLNVSVSGHKDTQPLIFTTDNNMIDVNADSSDPNQVIIKPNGTVANGIKVSAQAQGDRNYKDRKDDTILNIAQAGTQQFSAVFPSMTYGDAGPFKVTIIPAGDGTETYTYEVKDTNILDIDTNGDITIHHAGTTSVKVTKTSSGGVVGPYTFNVTVKPNPITIAIDDEEKYVGMAMPNFHANIPTLVGSDTLPQPDFTCEKANGTVVNAYTEQGTYDILGNYVNPNPDYKVTISKGELTVKQDTASTSWYHLEDADGNATQSSVWHKNPVDIVLNPNSTATAGTYNEISGDSTFTNTDKTRFTISNEGETTQDIYFRINPGGNDPNKGSITPPMQDTIRIDHTAPIIKSISGKDNGNSKTREFLNAVTFGQFFKPGLVVNIQAEDVEPTTGMNISGIAKTSYVINQLDSEGNPVGQGNTIDQQDDNIEISLKEPGNYEVCATATDNAGNESSEKCEAFEVKKIDVDVDKDGKPDFNDPDGNGCADFNIVYKDEDGNWETLNEDKDRDGIPERNIDTDGDGKPDINVDTDNDGKPDLNLVIITKDIWKPAQCVTQHGEQYASIVDIKPQINIDNDPATPNIPDINIDTDGDMKADFNIDTNNDKKPNVNIGIVHTPWKPNKDYTYQGFTYDTSTECKPTINIDTDGDIRADINIDTDMDGKPDLNIDINGDGIPDTNIDSTGNGKPDINIDTDKDGEPDENIYKLTEWKPNKDVDGKIPYDTMEIEQKEKLDDNGIIVEKPDGTFLPNYAIKVDKLSDEDKTNIETEIRNQLKENQEVSDTYDVKLLKDNVEIKPDGVINVKVPLPEGVKNPKVLVKKSNGSYEEVNTRIEDGYLVYETNELGTVVILNEKEKEIPPEPDPKPTPDPDPQEPKEPDMKEPIVEPVKPKAPATSVKGSYTSNPQPGIGGAYTGDQNEVMINTSLMIASMIVLSYLYKMKHKEKRSKDTF